MNLHLLRDRAPSIAVIGTTLAGLALVAPLEHAAGMALGLSDRHAWTVTLTVEGAAGAAIIAGHYVRAALALTGSSVLLGALWSADRAVRAEHHADTAGHPALTLADDPARAGLAAGVVALVVAALALVHYTRSRIADARAADAAAARERDQQDAAAAHGRQLELDRLADERAARERADAAQEAERQRRYTAELVRARAHDEQERERLRLDADRRRDEATRARADAERARAAADLERERLAAARAAADLRREEVAQQHEQAVQRRERDAAEREAAQKEREAADARSRQMLAGHLGDAAGEWLRLAEYGHEPDAEALAEIRGCTLRTAQNVISQWRRPHAVRGSDG